MKIYFDRMQEAILIMREVAAWGRAKGYRVWLDEWLTPEELIMSEAIDYPNGRSLALYEMEV